VVDGCSGVCWRARTGALTCHLVSTSRCCELSHDDIYTCHCQLCTRGLDTATKWAVLDTDLQGIRELTACSTLLVRRASTVEQAVKLRMPCGSGCR
jgi:hypothetical protein